MRRAHGHGHHAAAAGGLDAEGGVFEDHAARRLNADAPCGFEEDRRLGLAGQALVAPDDRVRMRVELEGETIVRADPEVGFLHRGFQKSCENVTWNQCLPYTDRLNYVSAIMNNLGFLKAVEALA